MIRILTLNLIFLIGFSCSGKKYGTHYDPKAIELNNQAVVLMQKMKNDSALLLFDQAIETDETYFLPHANKAGIYLSKNDLKSATEEMEQAVRINPDYAEGWNLAGMMHEKAGDIAQAASDYKKSIGIFDARISDPAKKDRAFANRLNRAVALILLGQENEGKEELMKLKAENPSFKVIDEILAMSKQDHLDRLMNGNPVIVL